MRFRFDFTLTEQDYLQFYTFHTMYARHGRKRYVTFRWILTIIPLIMVIITAGTDGRLSWEMLLRALPFLAMAAAFYFGYKPITKLNIRSIIKRQKKKEALPFAPKVGLWFYEDRFIEVTPDGKTSNKYGNVYAMYAQGRQMLYIYVNPQQAYLLPFTQFTSPARYEEFVRFIEMKTGNTVQECKALPYPKSK